MTVFFTSDTHWGHTNIIKYSKRPFKSIEEHDEALIRNWNSVVQAEDLVYHLGDVGMCSTEKMDKILARLNGQKYLIIGNHDKTACNEVCRKHFIWQKELAYIQVLGQKIMLCHYAMRVWRSSHRGSWMLYGHSHGSLKDAFFDNHSLSLDVGVDNFGYTPVKFSEVQKIMNIRNYKPTDGHVPKSVEDEV